MTCFSNELLWGKIMMWSIITCWAVTASDAPRLVWPLPCDVLCHFPPRINQPWLWNTGGYPDIDIETLLGAVITYCKWVSSTSRRSERRTSVLRRLSLPSSKTFIVQGSHFFQISVKNQAISYQLEAPYITSTQHVCLNALHCKYIWYLWRIRAISSNMMMTHDYNTVEGSQANQL